MLTGAAATVVLVTIEIVSASAAVITAAFCAYDWFHQRLIRK